MRDLDILKLQLFVLHSTDTISFPLFSPRFLRYNKQQYKYSVNNYRNIPQTLTESVTRLIYLRVYDSRASSSKPAPSPSSLCYSLTHALPNPDPPRRPYATHSHMHTAYTPSPSPRPRSSRSRALRSFGFLCVWPGLVPPAWPLDPLLGLLFFLLSQSLSLYRHPIICILFGSRFTSYNKQTTDHHHRYWCVRLLFTSHFSSK